MIKAGKKKIEETLYNFTTKHLKKHSKKTQYFLEPLQSNLIIRRFKRKYSGTPDNIPISTSYSKEIQHYWKQLLGIYINPALHHVIKSINGQEEPRYVLQEVWDKYFHPKLNPPKYHDPLIVDKNSLDLYISKNHLPKTVFKIVNGGFFSPDNKKITPADAKELLFQDNREKFVKPSRLFKGKGVFKIRFEDDVIYVVEDRISFAELVQRIDKDTIVQYAVDQHPKIASVHSNSLNTLRIMTIRIGTEIYSLKASIKFGADNKVADNTGNGVLCGINDDHTLKSIAYNRNLETFTKHVNSEIVFKEFGKVPGYLKAIDLCKEVHESLLFHDFAAWDVAVKKDGTPLIIELNSKPSILNWQIRFNDPLFLDHTEEVWNYISKK